MSEEVDRLGDHVDLVAQAAHRELQVLRATRMWALVAEELVAELVAGRDHHVVAAFGSVAHQPYHRPAEARDQLVAHPRLDREGGNPAVGRRQPFADIPGVEGKEVRCLASHGRRHPNPSAHGNTNSAALPGGDDGLDHGTASRSPLDCGEQHYRRVLKQMRMVRAPEWLEAAL